MAFADLVRTAAIDGGIQALGKATTGLKYFAHSFTPQTAQQWGAVAVPVYDMTAAAFKNGTEGSKNWCDGDEVGGLVVPLQYHSIAGISLPDTGIGLSAGTNYGGCAYGEQDATVAQIVRDATVGIVKALNKDIATNIYSNFTTANVAETYTLSGETALSGWGKAVAKAAEKNIDIGNAVMVLNKEDFYSKLYPALPANVIYQAQDSIKEGDVIENALGLKAIFAAPAALPTGVKGAIIDADAFGVVNRLNRPAINGYFDTFEITTEDGFVMGFRAFEHLCDGAMKFAGDVLYGSEFLHKNADGEAEGVLLLV